MGKRHGPVRHMIAVIIQEGDKSGVQFHRRERRPGSGYAFFDPGGHALLDQCAGALADHVPYLGFRDHGKGQTLQGMIERGGNIRGSIDQGAVQVENDSFGKGHKDDVQMVAKGRPLWQVCPSK